MSEELVTTRTPEAHAAVLAKLRGARPAVPWQPPSLEGTVVFPGMDGGGEWGGAAFDPESGLLYVNANDVPFWLQMIETPDTSGATGIGRATYVTACAMCHGLDRTGDGAGVPSLAGAVRPARARSTCGASCATGAAACPAWAACSPSSRSRRCSGTCAARTTSRRRRRRDGATRASASSACSSAT